MPGMMIFGIPPPDHISDSQNKKKQFYRNLNMEDKPVILWNYGKYIGIKHGFCYFPLPSVVLVYISK